MSSKPAIKEVGAVMGSWENQVLLSITCDVFKNRDGCSNEKFRKACVLDQNCSKASYIL